MNRKRKPDWSRRFAEPIYPKSGRPIETLRDAAKFITSLPHQAGDLAEWSSATKALMSAAEGGSVQAARDATWNAIFIRMMFDPKRLKMPHEQRRSDKKKPATPGGAAG